MKIGGITGVKLQCNSDHRSCLFEVREDGILLGSAGLWGAVTLRSLVERQRSKVFAFTPRKSMAMTNLFSPNLQYQGWSPLHFAAAYGELGRLKQLLDDGADPNYITPGKTPLHCACETGNLPIIEALIKGGADPNAFTLFDPLLETEGMCPLYIAYLFGHKQILKTLAQLGAKMNGQITDLHLCVLLSEMDTLDAILKRPTTDVNVRDYGDKTPLHVAAKHGLYSIASKLLQSETCSVNVLDKGNRTPLDFIVEHRIKQIFKADGIEDPAPPIEHYGNQNGTPRKSNVINPNPPLTDNHQSNPPYSTFLDKTSKDVIMCISNGYMNFIKLLLDRRVDLKCERDNRGYSPLHRAADASDYSLAKLLIGHDKSCVDDVTLVEGKTALHFSCQRGDERLVRFLLDSGASVNMVTERPLAETPLHLAIRRKHRDIVKRLLRKGALTDFIDYNKGHAPIHSAVINHANDIVQLLFAHGAVIDIRERWNKYTIMHLAWKSENMEQFENLLEKHGTIMDAADANGLTTFLTIVYDFIQAEPYTPRTYKKEKYMVPLKSLAKRGCLLSTSRLAAFQKNPTIRVTDLIFDVYCKENRDHIGHDLTVLLLGISCGTYDVIDKKLIKELCYCRHIDLLRFVRVCGFKSYKRKELRNIKDASLVEIIKSEPLALRDMCRLNVRCLLLAVQDLGFEKSDNGNRGPFRRLARTFDFLKRPTPERSLQQWRIEALPVTASAKYFLSFNW